MASHAEVVILHANEWVVSSTLWAISHALLSANCCCKLQWCNFELAHLKDTAESLAGHENTQGLMAHCQKGL